MPLTLKLQDSSAFVETAIASTNFVNLQNLEQNMNSRDPPHWTQSWQADDSACVSALDEVLFWIKLILKEGPVFGYHQE